MLEKSFLTSVRNFVSLIKCFVDTKYFLVYYNYEQRVPNEFMNIIADWKELTV